MNLPVKINEREKRFLVIGGLIALLIIGFYAFTWYGDAKKNVKEFSDARLLMLQKQQEKISGKENIQKRLEAVTQEIGRQEKTLLAGNTPPVAAAALQRLLKETAASLQIEIKQERTLNPVDGGVYLGIPVEIGFTSYTRGVKELLVRLRKSPFLLIVSEVQIRVTNISKPEEIYTTLVVTGFIKKAEEKVAAGKEAKNDT
ncbi:MAG: GspMb/PilO family protein [Nitrospirota bacterium]